jgi:hypothetical protein
MFLRDKNGIMKAKVSSRLFNHLMRGNGLPGKWRPYQAKGRKEEMVFEIVTEEEGYFFGDDEMRIYLWDGDIFQNEH